MTLAWRGPILSRWVFAGCATAALSVAAPTAAQDAESAEALFDRGVADMEAGRYEKACPAIKESQRLDPRPGTLFTLAECEAKRGRLATALGHYRDYLALYPKLLPEQQEKHKKREAIARAQQAALELEVPALKLSLSPSVPRGTVVTRDGVVVAEAGLGVAVPIDPGEHVVTVQAPGAPAIIRRVVLGPGDRKQILLDDKAPPPGEAPLPRVPGPQPVPASPTPQPDAGGRFRVAGFATGGVGLAGLALGAILGGLATEKKSEAAPNCGIGGKPEVCNHEGAAVRRSALGLANGSTVGFAVGGAALATGVVLLVLAPRRKDVEKSKAAGGERWIGAGALALDGTGAVAGVRGAW
jgi:hypothetical protein